MNIDLTVENDDMRALGNFLRRYALYKSLGKVVMEQHLLSVTCNTPEQVE